MKGMILALGVAAATLGFSSTAEAAGPPRGGHGHGYHRGHYHGGYGNYNRGYWPGYRSSYYSPYRGYYPGHGYRNSGYPGYGSRSYGYPGYGYGYGSGFSLGIRGPRGGALLFNFQ